MVEKVYRDGIIRDMTAEEQAKYDTLQIFANSPEQKLLKIKSIRLSKLKQTDWWVLRGEMTDEQRAWRQSLRDIPTTYSESDYDALLYRDEDEDEKLTHAVWSKP